MYLAGVRQAAARNEVEVVAFGHAGDGHLHVNALADTGRPDFEARLAALLDEVTELLVKLGGTPSGEHGDGRLRAPLLDRIFGSRITALFADVKRAFDPEGILNPGVIVPTPGSRAVAGLKVGPGAEPIPAVIETRLREMERAAAWDRPKDAMAG
jgi:FAD/FMN-containing dehydrogenase